jgi:hypothetical protein
MPKDYKSSAEPAKTKEPVVKKSNVKILQITTTLVPSPLGAGYGFVTQGLGADSLCYQWDSAKRIWLAV